MSLIEQQRADSVRHESALAFLDAKPAKRFRFMTVEELFTQPAVCWQVWKLIVERAFGVIFGASGAGKTFVAVDLACAIVRGVPWHGFRTRRGTVLYIATEGRMKGRIEAYMAHHGVTADELSGLRILETRLDLCNAGDAEQLVQEIQDLDIPDLAGVFIDTLNRAMLGGNENSSEDMGAMIASAGVMQDKLDAFVIFIHHAGKDESKGARGHSSLKAACDVEFNITRQGKQRTATAGKVRDDEDGVEIMQFNLAIVDLGVDDHGEPITSCAIEPLSPGEKQEGKRGHLSINAEEGLHCLQITIDDRSNHVLSTVRDVAAGAAVDSTGVSVNAWRQGFYDYHPERKLEGNRSAFRRAKTELEEKHRIVVNEHRVWLRPNEYRG